MAPRSLAGRLAIAQMAVVVLVMAALGLYLMSAARSLYVDRLGGQMAGDARLIGEVVGPVLAGGESVERVDPIAKRLGTVLDARVTIVGSDGTVLGESTEDPRSMENHGSRPEVVAARAVGTGRVTRHSTTLDADYLYVAQQIPGKPGAVARVALPLTDIDQAVGRIQRDLLVATFVAMALVAVVAMAIARRVVGPLDDLRRQARAVAAGRLDVAVKPAAPRELGEVGRAFNLMTARLRSSTEEVERTRSRLEATLASLSDGVVITGADGTVMRLNGAAARMLETTAAAATGQHWVQVCRDHELAELLRRALSDRTGSAPSTATVEYGLNRRALDTAAQRLTVAHEILGLVVLRDVTELRRLERVRREFVANVSHELRTPLASIKALVETLEAGAIDDPDVSGDFLQRIVGEVDRLALLVDELLDLARLESGRVTIRTESIEPIDLLGPAVERLAAQLGQRRLRLRFDVPEGLPHIRADRARIEQVILNLVHNAMKFTPAGGTITVRAREDGSLIRIDVQDTGVGVAADELPRLFERFYKADKARRSDGTGLGLAIAKHIVQAHGGTIWAESRFGHGATFSFTLPAAGIETPLAIATPAGSDG